MFFRDVTIYNAVTPPLHFPKPIPIFTYNQNPIHMAKYIGPHKISGTINGVTFTRNGVARSKSSLDKRKWRKARKMANTRRTAAEFGGASRCSGALIRAIPSIFKPLARKMPHNYLGQLLCKNARLDSFEGRQHYNFESALPVIFNLDLSKAEHLSALLRLKTKGHPLAPTELCINGLRDIADAIPPVRNYVLQCKIHFLFVVFPEVSFDELSKDWDLRQPAHHCLAPSSGWIGPEWVPEEGLRIALKNPEPDHANFLLIAIEWRRIAINRKKRKDQKPSEMQEFGIIKVAALFRAKADLTLPIPAYLRPSQARKFRLLRKRPRPKLAAILTPEMRLRAARPRPRFVHPKDTRNNNIIFLLPKPPKAG